MEFRVYEVVQDNTVFRIEEDYPEVGVYLYVIENGKCVKDFLQDSIEVCKSLALEEYGIPIESWRLVNE
jgi:hypothetical protein